MEFSEARSSHPCVTTIELSTWNATAMQSVFAVAASSIPGSKIFSPTRRYSSWGVWCTKGNSSYGDNNTAIGWTDWDVSWHRCRWEERFPWFFFCNPCILYQNKVGNRRADRNSQAFACSVGHTDWSRPTVNKNWWSGKTYLPPALDDNDKPNDAFESDVVMTVGDTVLCIDSNDNAKSTLVLPARWIAHG